MAITAITTLTTVLPEVEEVVFKDLVKELVSNAINGGDSPFSEVRGLLTDELDKTIDLDANQRAGIYSDFLKDTFAEVNKQAMSTALQILKTNEELKLQAYTTEANYNKTMQEFANLGLQETGLGLDNQIKEQQALEAVEKVKNAKLTGLEMLAKLKKQYGYDDASVATVLDADTLDALIAFRDVLIAEQALLISPEDDVEIAEYQVRIDKLTEEITNTTTTLGASTGTGALDKQIIGYDKVNYKDVMKTGAELGSMLANAGDELPAWVKNLIQDNASAASGIAIDTVDHEAV